MYNVSITLFDLPSTFPNWFWISFDVLYVLHCVGEVGAQSLREEEGEEPAQDREPAHHQVGRSRSGNLKDYISKQVTPRVETVLSPSRGQYI